MKKNEAIFFDLDGTLIDSMPLFRQSVAEALTRQGGTLTPEYFMTWHAGRLPWADLLAEYKIDLAHEEEVQMYSKKQFQELLRTQISWMPGAKELLHSLKKEGIPSAIVTTAFKSFVDAVNEKISIYELVDLFITAEDAGDKGKPNPYSLLLAAEKLGIDAKDCIYIGDQPFDVIAANAADMQSWLVQHPHTPKDAGRQATRVFANLFEVSRVLNPES